MKITDIDVKHINLSISDFLSGLSNISFHSTHVKYSMLLISDAILIAGRPLIIVNIKH